MPLNRIREFFMLRRAARLAELGKSRSDAEARRFLVLARQRLTAGHSLWDVGFRADGMRLTFEALDAAIEASRRMSPAPAPPDGEEAPPEADEGADRERALERLEVDRKIRARVADALKDTSVPVLDEEIKPEHERRYESAARSARQLLSAMQPLLLTPARVSMKRIGRFATVALVATVLLFVGYRWAFPAPKITVTASEERGRGEHPATFAFDGNPQTEWLLENRHRGYLDFELVPPRRIAAVKLLNAHNPPFNDRATRRYRIELHGEGDQPTILRGEFRQLTPSPAWVNVPVGVEGGLPGVSQIRVYADSHHGEGAGLAEVALEEVAGP